jgi:hypothetical protein
MPPFAPVECMKKFSTTEFFAERGRAFLRDQIFEGASR